METGLRSSSAFTVRRCQILIASAEGQSTTTIARELRCTDQTVRNTMHAFHQRGLAVLRPLSSRPHATSTIFDAGVCASLRALVHQSPRTFGPPTSRWTLALAAEVRCAQGLPPRAGSATKPCVSPSAGCGCPGSGPRMGSPAPIRPIAEKKPVMFTTVARMAKTGGVALTLLSVE